MVTYYRQMNAYLIEPSDVEAVKNGTAKIGGKPILAVDSDMRTATRRIFAALSQDKSLAIVAGLGLSAKASTGLWKRLSVTELRDLILSKFILVKPEVGEGGRTRFRILDGPPNPIWVATLTQNRWLTCEVQSWFPAVEQPKMKIIKTP